MVRANWKPGRASACEGGQRAMALFQAKAKTDTDAAREEAESSGLICGYILDGKGAGTLIGWPEVKAWKPEQGTLWVHLNRKRKGSETYVREQGGFDPFVAAALLAEDARPRMVRQGNGILVNFRGVNFNQGAEPEDMISLRAYVEKRRIVTTRARHMMAAEDLRREIASGRGPRDEFDLLFRFASLLLTRVGSVVQELEDGIDQLEDEVLAEQLAHSREKLGVLRKRAITIRRHLVPQRDALTRLEVEPSELLDSVDSARFRELADETQRYIEDLDNARDRAVVIQDEIANRMTERQSRNSYTLSVVAAIMLPLSFVTSLFGVSFRNVPLMDDPQAFWTLIVALAVLAAVQVVVFRLMRWF